MEYLSLIVPGSKGSVNLKAPGSIPEGGLPELATAFQNSTTIIIAFAVVACLVFVIWSGIQMITSEGDKQKVMAARSRLIYALIGLILIFLSFAIVGIMSTVFKVNLLGK